MQSTSSLLLDFSHSPSKITSKKFEPFMKQQKVDKSNNNTPTNYPISPESQAGVTTSIIHKLAGFAAYASATISDTYNTLTAGGETEPQLSARKRRSYDSDYLGDVMQINADDSDGAYDNDEMSDVEMEYDNQEINKKSDKKMDGKDEAKWEVNDDEEEPPPPYDSSWTMPTTSTYNTETNSGENVTDSPLPSSPKRISFATPQVDISERSATISQTVPKRRQIRVRRTRRLLRKKSATEVSTPRGGEGRFDDPDKLLLKVNDKLSDMIAQGREALKSTVDITEVELLLAEERERDERIMKELGLQAPIVRKGRKNSSYPSLDYEYSGSISDGNYSSPEYSFYEYGYNAHSGHGSGFASPTEYETPDAYPSHGHYNTPSQFSPPAVYHQTQGGYNFSNLGSGINGNEFVNPIPNRSGGYGDHATSKGFGAGPISGGFGGNVRFGRFAPNSPNHNNGFNYGSNFGSNAGGFVSNGFGSNGGYRVYNNHNNNREFLY